MQQHRLKKMTRTKIKTINITNQSVNYQQYIIRVLSFRMLKSLIVIAITLSLLSVLCFITNNAIIAFSAVIAGLISILSLFIIREILIKEIMYIINKKNLVYEFHIDNNHFKVINNNKINHYNYMLIKKSYIINDQYLAVLVSKYKYYLLNLDTFVIGNSQDLYQIFQDNSIKLINISIPFSKQ